MVKLETEKNTIEHVPDIKAHIKRLNASVCSKKFKAFKYTIKSPLPNIPYDNTNAESATKTQQQL
ncbi:hypothetical protein [Formosa algae]|uniref:hypothetical protein n=1 Tax=Formosa algae TaxID=225843 RepID=UPI00209C6939|nr:hypothetical protein [Formosa algae]